MTQALTHNGLPDGLTRWQFFGLIQTARIETAWLREERPAPCPAKADPRSQGAAAA